MSRNTVRFGTTPGKSTAARWRRLATPLSVAIILAITGSMFLWRSFAANNPNLAGDLNGDNTVSIVDLSILLRDFGKQSADGDIDGDGKVGVSDLSRQLSNFGKIYTPPNPTPPTPTPPNPTPPIPSRKISILPFGTSTVEGLNSPGSGGFRTRLYNRLTKEDKLDLDFVGTLKSSGPASLPDRDHEGWGGLFISTGESQLSGKMTNVLNRYNPDIILFYAGSNDIAFDNVNATTATARLDAIIAKVYSRQPDVKFLLGTVLPFKAYCDSRVTVQEVAWIQDFNDSMPAIAAKYQAQGRYLKVIDTSAVANGDFSDCLHTNEAGYDKMADAWVTGVRAAYPSL